MSASAPAESLQPALSAGLVALLAFGAGLSVASIYYNQPMLGLLGSAFDASASQIGWIPTLTQLGYAAGILLLAPLGDRYDRRRIITGKCAALCVCLLAAAVSQSLVQLCVASAAIGLSATVVQDLVPAAATLSPERSRGQTVGTVMTGLLLGILLSRVVSGAIAQLAGWRVVFACAAVAVAALGVLLRRRLPSFAATTTLPYHALLATLLDLFRRHGALRRAALAQGFISAAFSAFWSTLAVALHQPPFNLGSAAAGAFGIAGAIGALAAPLAGRMADRRGPEGVARTGVALVFLSFVAMAALPSSLAMLIAGTLVFDLGVQVALIAHQSIVYALEPAARSRLNAVLVGSMFIGMASGAAGASVVLQYAGWRGVCLSAAFGAMCAMAVRMAPRLRST